MAFLALERNRKRFPISVCASKRSFGVMFTEPRKPWQGTVETVSLKMRQFCLYYDKILAKFNTEKNFFHNTRSLQENNARSAANQSARTIVAI